MKALYITKTIISLTLIAFCAQIYANTSKKNTVSWVTLPEPQFSVPYPPAFVPNSNSNSLSEFIPGTFLLEKFQELAPYYSQEFTNYIANSLEAYLPTNYTESLKAHPYIVSS